MRRMLLSTILLQTGCFRGLFSEAPRYLATEYVVDRPRIVALKSGPIEMVSGTPTTFDALLVAPKGASIQSWKMSVCGLDPTMDTPTYIWDLLCFEKQEVVSQLFQSSELPHTFAVPTFPEIDCNNGNYRPMDTGLREDTGWWEEGYGESTCSHYLPLMIEATVDDTPVYAAAFTNWYPTVPYHLRRNTPLSEAGIGLRVEDRAVAGSEIALEISVATDARDASFQWYIDAGQLIDTGITSARTYVEPNDTQPYAQTTSHNRLVIPTDYQGALRIWVVVHQPWGHDLDMTWTSTTIEVTP